MKGQIKKSDHYFQLLSILNSSVPFDTYQKTFLKWVNKSQLRTYFGPKEEWDVIMHCFLRCGNGLNESWEDLIKDIIVHCEANFLLEDLEKGIVEFINLLNSKR